MSNVNTTQVTGDVSVSRNVAIGGTLTTQGTTKFNGRVKVEGWLDAPNIKGPSKGLFDTEDNLVAYYPKPHNGWWALVIDHTEVEKDDDGNETEYVWALTYIGFAGTWHNTGKQAKIELEYTDLEERLEDLIARIIAVEGQAQQAVDTANTAKEEADQAVATADAAKEAADNAVTTANEAKSTADSAASTANEAKSIAESAVETANNAVTEAETAKEAAEEAAENAKKCGILPFDYWVEKEETIYDIEAEDGQIAWVVDGGYFLVYNSKYHAWTNMSEYNNKRSDAVYRIGNTLYRYDSDTKKLVRIVDETDLEATKSELEVEIAAVASKDSGILSFDYWVDKEETIYDLDAQTGDIAWVADLGAFLQMNEYGGWTYCNYTAALNDVLFRLGNTLYRWDSTEKKLVEVTSSDLSEIEERITVIEERVGQINIYPFDGIVDDVGHLEVGKIFWDTEAKCFYKGITDESGYNAYVKVYEDVLETAVFQFGNEFYRYDSESETLVRIVDETDLAKLEARIATLEEQIAELSYGLTVRMEIDTQGDTAIGINDVEPFKASCSVWKGWQDITSTVTSWKVERDSGDEEEDKAWDAEHTDFAGSIELTYTDLGADNKTVYNFTAEGTTEEGQPYSVKYALTFS